MWINKTKAHIIIDDVKIGIGSRLKINYFKKETRNPILKLYPSWVIDISGDFSGEIMKRKLTDAFLHGKEVSLVFDRKIERIDSCYFVKCRANEDTGQIYNISFVHYNKMDTTWKKKR